MYRPYREDLKFLKLSGSFTRGESEGVTSREGGMSIALSSPGGRVVGEEQEERPNIIQAFEKALELQQKHATT
ncbi:hypothetical protein Tco_1514053, partial [Tanacetum coccineum]